MAKGTKKKKKELTIEEKLEQALVPEEEWPYEVPENWCWTTVKSVAEVVTGGTPSKKRPEYYGDEFPFFKPSDLDAGRNVYNASEYLSEEGKEISRIIPPFSSAVCCIGSIGKCGFLMREGATNQQINSAIPKITPLYLYYYFLTESFVSELWSKASATTISIVNKSKMEQCLFPLAPLAEQQRIVNRIESLFTKLDEAKEKAQAVVDGYEGRKAGILQKAFTGELTEGWRNSKGIHHDSWRECELITILKDKPRNGYSPKPVNYVTPYKSMTLSATTSGIFLPEHYKYIDEKIPEDSYLWLKPGDILMQRANSLEKVGTSAMYTGREHEFIYPDLIMKLQVNEQAIPEYVACYMKTSKVLQYLRTNATGTAGNMPKINQKVVSKIPIVLPLIDEQSEIVRKLDMLLNMEQLAKEAAVKIIDQIDTMKKSILSRAFRGELGTNDPADESAGELLRRILKGALYGRRT